MNEQKGQVFSRFVEAIDEAVSLLDAPAVDDGVRELVDTESLPSLLEQCRSLVAEADAERAEPIRTIDHFACTGGTLISKCLASLPNVHLLSEVDPLSEIGPSLRTRFLPTDLVGLARAGSRKVGDDLLFEIFLRGLSAIYEYDQQRGLHLVLRGHAHSAFCVGQDVQERPTLRSLLNKSYSTRSVVTVRHPVDSWLSLLKNNWVNFEPGTLDEYARRYLTFIDSYSDCDVFKYEDFVLDPFEIMRQICTALELPFDSSFLDSFPAHTLSGDSGRRGWRLEPRVTDWPEAVTLEARESPELEELCSRLNYSLDAVARQGK